MYLILFVHVSLLDIYVLSMLYVVSMQNMAYEASTKVTRRHEHSCRFKSIEHIVLGISASYVGVSETIVHFVIYEQIKVQLHNNSKSEHPIVNFVSYMTAAACSKLCASTLCYPHEVIRTRLREEGNKYRTFIQTFKTIFYEETFLGLYRGLFIHLIRQIPVGYCSMNIDLLLILDLVKNTAIVMSTYELILAFLLSNTMMNTSTTTTKTQWCRRMVSLYIRTTATFVV
jgi:hypothetical protein